MRPGLRQSGIVHLQGLTARINPCPDKHALVRVYGLTQTVFLSRAWQINFQRPNGLYSNQALHSGMLFQTLTACYRLVPLKRAATRISAVWGAVPVTNP